MKEIRRMKVSDKDPKKENVSVMSDCYQTGEKKEITRRSVECKSV